MCSFIVFYANDCTTEVTGNHKLRSVRVGGVNEKKRGTELSCFLEKRFFGK